MDPDNAWRPEVPPNDAKIWRYMSLAKYVSLLTTKSLFFCRADLLGDPFEGAVGKNVNAPPYVRPPSIRGRTAPREKFYINSWHIQTHELAAMWSTYGGHGESVAIRSTYGRLRDAFPSEIIIGKVSYIQFRDYNPELEETELRRYFTKRRSFQTDRELRAIYNHDLGRNQKGVHRDVNLNEILMRVYVSPATQDWYLQAVRELTARFKLNVDVYKSPLDTGAVY